MSLDVSKIQDPEQLREIARLLALENDKLHGRLEKLAGELDKLKGRAAEQLQREIAGLRRQLKRHEDSFNKPSSQRRNTHRHRGKPDEDKKPQTGGRRLDQPELPIVEETRTLDESERTCERCGEVAGEIEACEETEFVGVVERTFRLKRVKRQKYVRVCTCPETPPFTTAPGPMRLVPKGRFSVLFATVVALAKYHEHDPLHQQAARMKRQGLEVAPNVLWDQLLHLRTHVAPTYDAIHEAALDEPVLGADETGYPMLEKGRTLWQVVCLVAPKLSYFRVGPRKDTEALADLLTLTRKGADGAEVRRTYGGVLVTDGNSTYGAARRETEATFTWSHCWSHVRTKFLEAEPNYPEASEALDLIDELFDIEQEALALSNAWIRRAAAGEVIDGIDADAQTLAALSKEHESSRAALAVPNPFLLEARARLRKEKSRPVLKKLRRWLTTHATKWDGSDLNTAIRYTDRRWKALRLFVTRPPVPIHNNDSEFALRRPVMGRRRFYGIKSRLGASVAAVFYTLFESARKNGLDPLAYVLTVAVRAILEPGTVTLPWDITSGAVALLDPKDFE